MQDGQFTLSEARSLDVREGRALPFTLGHEIAGVVEAAGPEAEIATGSRVAVYPWIGCSDCAACTAGEENLCNRHRHLGIASDGGFASHVLVPHPRYLIGHEPLSPAFAGALMCSGLTAYSALKRVATQAGRGPVLLVGMGGVGMMGLALARVLFDRAPLVADIDPAKREAALAAGAAAAFDPSDPQARRTILKSTGGLPAACDFVGTEPSLAFATGVLAKGGKAVVTGLIGGNFSMPVSMIVLKAIAIEGAMTGTLAEAREIVELARSRRLPALPIEERPMAEASRSLDDLRAGRVLGRIVLTA
jgi:D-arabinose 1-dehydrogenase-like Zn-dependent alcohol dehydrogenase